MLPWNYGFHWSTGTIIFLGTFYVVLTVIAVTLVRVWVRTRRDFRARKVDAVRWHTEFEDLPARDRACRHEITGEFRRKTCQRGFDCRGCELHARLPAAAPAAAVETDVFGLDFPLDRLYHRGHTWVQPEPDGTCTVGLDELGRRLMGKPDSIELPPAGAELKVNTPAWRMRKGAGEVRILAPVDGTVIATGGPEQGWFLKLKPAAPAVMTHLLRGREIRPWILRELERLQLLLGPAPTLADGGVPVEDISAAYPAADWDALRGEMFLQP